MMRQNENSTRPRARKSSLAKRNLYKFFTNKMAVLGLSIILIMILSAVFAPLISPYSPTTVDPANRYLPSSAEHWLGTDQLGRDLLTYLFIAHDLSVVQYMSDRIAVMYLGKVMELASADELCDCKAHPYTEALLSAVPIPIIGAKKNRIILKGDVPSPVNPPSGCRFHPRCPKATPLCAEEEPQLLPMKGKTNHFVACHYADCSCDETFLCSCADEVKE